MLFENQNPEFLVGSFVVIGYVKQYISFLFIPQLDKHNALLPDRFLSHGKSQNVEVLVEKQIEIRRQVGGRNRKEGGNTFKEICPYLPHVLHNSSCRELGNRSDHNNDWKEKLWSLTALRGLPELVAHPVF